MPVVHSLRVFIMRIQLPDKVLYKIGSSRNNQYRLNSFVNADKPSSLTRGQNIPIQDLSIIASTFCTNLDPSYKCELKRIYKAYMYKGPPVLPSGNGEVFTSNILEFELRKGSTLLVPCLILPTHRDSIKLHGKYEA